MVTLAEAVLTQRTVGLRNGSNISDDEKFEIAAALQSSDAQVQDLTIRGEFLTTLQTARAIGGGLKANKSVQEVLFHGSSYEDDPDDATTKLAMLVESGFLTQVPRVLFYNCRFNQDARKFISQALLHDDSQIKDLRFWDCDWIEVKEILKHGLGQRVEKLGLTHVWFDVPSLEAILRDSKVRELLLSSDFWIGKERNRANLVELFRCIRSAKISSVGLGNMSTDGAVVLSEHLLGAGNDHLLLLDLRSNYHIGLEGYEALLSQGLVKDTTVLEFRLGHQFSPRRINQICRANKALGSLLWDGERRPRLEWPFLVAQIAKHPAALAKLLRGLLPVEELLRDCPITMRQV